MIIDIIANNTTQQRYLRFGQTRTLTGYSSITATDFNYTGQRTINGLGLMDYHARMYDSLLGRFIQPDTILPSEPSPQSLNRFSYVLNNPIDATDPTGHISCYGENADDGPQCYQPGKINNLGHNQPMGSKAKTNGCSYDDDKCLLQHRNSGGDNNNPSMSLLQTATIVTQDLATITSGTGVLIEGSLTVLGCVAGEEVAIVGGCVGGLWVGIASYNASGLNLIQTGFSWVSTGFTALNSLTSGTSGIKNGGIYIDEDLATSLTTSVLSTVSIEAVTDTIFNGYSSGYSHGVLPGIYHLDQSLKNMLGSP